MKTICEIEFGEKHQMARTTPTKAKNMQLAPSFLSLMNMSDPRAALKE